jgi:PAS domain S-box-containing protein/putative nucleotidyltransferase with HDIG domain
MQEELFKHLNRVSFMNMKYSHGEISPSNIKFHDGITHSSSKKRISTNDRTDNKERILLVDDDENTRNSLKLIFIKHGYILDTASTAQKALEAARAKPYDLAIVDIRLPDQAGISLIKPLKEMNSQIAVLMVTAYASTDTAIEALNHGASAYITKPINIDELLIKVKDIIEKKRLVMENKRLYELALQEIEKYKQKEKELKESKKKFEELVNQLPQIVYECDISGRVTYANKNAYKVFGYTKRDLEKGLSAYDVIAPEEREKVSQDTKKILNGEKLAEIEYTALRKDGSRFPMLIFFSHIIEAGRITGIRGIAVDITRQKRAEEEACHSAEQLHKLMKTAPALIFQIDTHGIIQHVNYEFVNTTGYTYKQVKGKHWSEFGMLPQEDIQLLSAKLKEKFDGITHEDTEIKIKRKDGKPVWLTIRGEVIKDGDTITGLQIIGHNITERKKAEEKLKENKERYEILFKHMNDGVFVYSKNPDNTPGKLIEVNEAACTMLEYTKEELLNLAPYDYVKSDTTCKSPGKACIQALSNKNKVIAEKIYTTKNGRKIIVEASSQLFEYRNKPIVITMARDISQRKKTEEELQRSCQSLQQVMNDTITTMASLVELKDPYTAGHQVRVSKLACAIAQEIGLSTDQIDGIRAAGLVHDIGKISIPSEILSKPGMLNETEFTMIKTHPLVGYEILKKIEFPWPVAQTVQQHHERLNGSGYPYGLFGNDISIEARIISVADIVEAMATHRPYRPALGISEALKEIMQNKETLYDPQIVDACIHLFNVKGFQFEQ